MKDFLKGIIFVALIAPILDNIISITNQLTEYLCMCIAVKTANKQAEITLKNEEEEYKAPAIGFQIPSLEDKYEEDE